MNPSIASPRKQLLLTIALVCALSVFGASGGFSLLLRGGDAALEFVGNLITGIQNISLDRFDPTCPRCI